MACTCARTRASSSTLPAPACPRGDRVPAMSTVPTRAKTATGPDADAKPPAFAAFREVPRTGVIYVTTEANRRGYTGAGTSDDWCNLGQGMPDSEALPGAP